MPKADQRIDRKVHVLLEKEALNSASFEKGVYNRFAYLLSTATTDFHFDLLDGEQRDTAGGEEETKDY